MANTESKPKEDPEEVAAREVNEQAAAEPVTEEADKKVLRANAKAEKEANKDADGEAVDPAVHQPHMVAPRKV